MSNPYGTTYYTSGTTGYDNILPQDVLDNSVNAGIGWLRFQVSWNKIETSAGVYDWTNLDDLLPRAHAAGLKVVWCIQDAPSFRFSQGTGGVNYLPGPTEMSTFASVASTRYNGVTVNPGTGHPYGLLDAIQIGNEDWAGGNNNAAMRDPSYYTPVVHPTAAAIRSNSPTTLIGACSLLHLEQPYFTNYIQALYTANVAQYVDFLDFHFYGAAPADCNVDTGLQPDGSGTSQPTLQACIKAIHDVCVANGDSGKDIWCTEFGSHTTNMLQGDDCATWDIQARDYYTALQTLRESGVVSHVFIYTLANFLDGYSMTVGGHGAGNYQYLPGYYEYKNFITRYPNWSATLGSPITVYGIDNMLAYYLGLYNGSPLGTQRLPSANGGVGPASDGQSWNHSGGVGTSGLGGNLHRDEAITLSQALTQNTPVSSIHVSPLASTISIHSSLTFNGGHQYRTSGDGQNAYVTQPANVGDTIVYIEDIAGGQFNPVTNYAVNFQPVLQVNADGSGVLFSSGTNPDYFRLGATSVQDQSVLLRMATANSNDTIGPVARLTGTTDSTINGYSLTLHGTTLALNKIVNGVVTVLTSQTITRSTSNREFLRIEVTGTSTTTLNGVYWQDIAQAEPTTATISTTDTSSPITTGGYGYTAKASTATPVQMDTFRATSPQLSVISTGTLSVSPSSFTNGNFTQSVVLSNPSGRANINWSASCAGVTFTPSSGTLAGGATQSVSISIPTTTTNNLNFVFATTNATNTSVTVPWTYVPPVVVSNFVTRSGSQLFLNGQSFRFGGCNMYGAGLFQQDDLTIRYPTSFELTDAFATAQEMGGTVVRAHTLGISVGTPLSVEPTLGTFNETALVHIDQAIATAALYKQRLIIPLIDPYQYYHGGISTFLGWRSLSNISSTFYTNAQVIADFQQYVHTFLTRRNTITGLYYSNDPTILGWQLGNELVGVPTSWLTTMASYIKSYDTNHLIIDGTYGVVSANLALSQIDMYDNHFYSTGGANALNTTQLASDAAACASANKCYVALEFDWLLSSSQAQLVAWLSAVQSTTTVAGDCFWSLLFHNDVSGFTTHNDGFSLYYPGQDANTHARATFLRTHEYFMQGVVPAPAPIVPATPTLVFSQKTMGSVTQTIADWQGTMGAAQYQIEQSLTSPSGPFAIIGYPLNGPLSFPTSHVYLRITPQNVNGVSGVPSPIISPLPFLPPTHNIGQFGIGVYQSLVGGVSGGNGLTRPYFVSLGLPNSGISGGTFGFLLDTTIRAPQQAQWTPAQEIGLDTHGLSVVRGYPSLIWSYGRLRPDAWYYLKKLYTQAGNAPPGYEYLVLLQYPDPQQNGALVRMLARWQPLTHSDRDVAVFENVQLRFTYVGLAQLDPNVSIQVL